MSIYIGNDLEDRLEELELAKKCNLEDRLKALETENANRRNISNCWSNGEKLMTFNTGNAKDYDHCFTGDIGTTYGTMSGRSHLIGCIGEIIGFYRSLTDEETSHIHQYLMKKWGI